MTVVSRSNGKVMLNGTPVRRKTHGVGDRSIYMTRIGVLKVDGTIQQSASEWTNYNNTPARWRKYLAEALDAGYLDGDDSHDDKDWVLQKRIGIVRANSWAADTSDKPDDFTVNEWSDLRWAQANVWEEFADALQFAITGWLDHGQRQWSVAGSRFCLHDYASDHPRSSDYYTSNSWLKRWEAFMDEWNDREHELDWKARIKRHRQARENFVNPPVAVVC